jgi:hypothetical protein
VENGICSGLIGSPKAPPEPPSGVLGVKMIALIADHCCTNPIHRIAFAWLFTPFLA